MTTKVRLSRMRDKNMERKTCKVKCTQCGNVRNIPEDQITEGAKARYVCETCSDPCLENRVATMEDTAGGRKLLID